jgi:transposase
LRGTETGARQGDAKFFYQQLGAPVLIGMEATGNSQWFVELVEDLGHEIWIGDAAQIRASYVRKQRRTSGMRPTF